jgi:hypothetical protein
MKQPGGFFNISTDRMFTKMLSNIVVGVMFAKIQLEKGSLKPHSFPYLTI